MLKLNLTGVELPQVSIKINNEVVFEGVINGQQQVDLPVVFNNKDTVSIVGINKRNGENGIYDTKLDDNGNIISDKYLIINDIIINNISMGSKWIKSINHLENCTSTGMYKNGEISFTVNTPLLDWIIEEKFIKQDTDDESNKSTSYSGTGRFDYEYIHAKIVAIRNLLND